MTSPDIPILIYKLRNAPQLVGTFGRGDPDPLEQYRLVMTGEEREIREAREARAKRKAERDKPEAPLYPGGIDDMEI
jgi:hypothetical protein